MNIKGLRFFRSNTQDGEPIKYNICVIDNDIVWIIKRMLLHKDTISKKQIKKRGWKLLRKFKNKYYVQDSFMIKGKSLNTIFAIVNGVDGVFRFKQM